MPTPMEYLRKPNTIGKCHSRDRPQKLCGSPSFPSLCVQRPGVEPGEGRCDWEGTSPTATHENDEPLLHLQIPQECSVLTLCGDCYPHLTEGERWGSAWALEGEWPSWPFSSAIYKWWDFEQVTQFLCSLISKIMGLSYLQLRWLQGF